MSEARPFAKLFLNHFLFCIETTEMSPLYITSYVRRPVSLTLDVLAVSFKADILGWEP